jgi:hypothetical protein
VALFKILRGNAASLASTDIHEGYMYITKDTGEIYVDTTPTTRIKLNGDAANKIRKITYNADGSYKSELSLTYDDILATIQAGDNDKVSKSDTGVQCIAGGLVVGKDNTTNVSATGQGRIMFTGQANPLIGLQAMNGAGNTGTPWYVQAIYNNDTLCIGPSSNALTFDTNGNMKTPAQMQAAKFIGPLEGNATSATNATNIYSSASTAKAYILGTTTASNANHATVYNGSVYTSGSVLYGAAWNDYAEYRDQVEMVEPGYCVRSADDGRVSKTTEKLQACDGIVSDTFGFAIGETEICKTPLAVAGRVLAYAENPSELHAGDTVCAGPEGKVVKMTREEIREWPDRIVGIVSEIPAYETWGSGNVPVNGRVWIKIR